MTVELPTALAEVKERIDLFLSSVLEERPLTSRVREMISYTLLPEGKRVRPALCLWACQAVGGDPARALEAAAGVECLHAFSLVHDDLPGMDDAPLRRGKPSVHRAYGLGEAILTGDALFALGMEWIGHGLRALEAAEISRLMVESSRAVGAEGMIGGQFDDIRPRTRSDEDWRWLDERKTSRLFQLALRLGCALGGGTAASEEALLRYGLHLGLAFQLEDDLLDLNEETTPSWARQLGPQETLRRIADHGREARRALASVPGETSLLAALVDHLAGRRE